MDDNQAPPVEAQNQTVPTAETPEVAAPETDENQQPEQKAPEEDPAAKSQRAMERRIQRLTAARYQEQARAQQALEQAQQLQARLAQYEAPPEPQQDAPDPVRIASELRLIEKTTEKSNAVANDGKARFPDFMTAVQKLNAEVGAMTDNFGRPTPMLKAILGAKDPAALIHHLGTNPDEAADLASLGSHTERVWRLAEIAAAISQPKEPKQSTAPKAIPTVKGATRDDGGVSDSLSTEEWIKRRNKQARG